MTQRNAGSSSHLTTSGNTGFVLICMRHNSCDDLTRLTEFFLLFLFKESLDCQTQYVF